MKMLAFVNHVRRITERNERFLLQVKGKEEMMMMAMMMAMSLLLPNRLHPNMILLPKLEQTTCEIKYDQVWLQKALKVTWKNNP